MAKKSLRKATNMAILLPFIYTLLLMIHSAAAAGISPPEDNCVDFSVKARGFQIYSCSPDTSGKLSWTLNRAEAELYDSNFSSKLGLHYFLPHPDAGGGRASWALYSSASDKFPSSTVTGKTIAMESGGEKNIDLLLVQATSHSGQGGMSRTSYIQRLDTRGGVAPHQSECRVRGAIARVPYESGYTFWNQLQQQQHTLPSSEYHSEMNTPPSFVLFAEGHQHYAFNGSAWELFNASASLSPIPGREIVGDHFFLPLEAPQGGKPTWTYYQSSVTAKPVETIKAATGENISWVDLVAVGASGHKRFLGAVTRVQRRATRGGLPPSPSLSPRPRIGDKFLSPYTALYWFY